MWIKSDKLCACSFSMMWARCNSTVRKLMPRRRAMALLGSPAATSSKTSRSRAVNEAARACNVARLIVDQDNRRAFNRNRRRREGQAFYLNFDLIVRLFLIRIGTRCLRFWPDMMIAMSGHVPIIAAFLRRLAGDLSRLWRLWGRRRWSLRPCGHDCTNRHK
jgi:hypothetical protein